MKRFWLFLLMALLVLWQAGAPLAASANQSAAQQQALQSMTKEQRDQLFAVRQERFQSAREMLLQKKVPFDPELLLSPDWKRSLSPTLKQMPEMQTSFYQTAPLDGVYLADTLYLPEHVELAGETIILANRVIFEGTDVLVRGHHTIYLYPVQRIGVMGTTLKELREASGPLSRGGAAPALDPETSLPTQPIIVRGGHVTIDTSGYGRKEWLAGEPKPKTKGGFTIQDCPCDTSGSPGGDAANGSSGSGGSNGATGSAGANATCSPAINATEGSPGGNGGTGGTGGRGFDGGNGSDAGDIYCYLDGNTWGSYSFVADGGNGGNGGNGGKGGKGGNGAQGGTGGAGVACCADSGVRNGADGGRGGSSGDGGAGGAGGDGGNGGNGGYIYVSWPLGQVTISGHSESPGLAGAAGSGGLSGEAGTLAGAGGPGGAGASIGDCAGGSGGLQGDSGGIGSYGAGGADGSAGTGGNPGYYYPDPYPGCAPSPIVISTKGKKIDMTDADDGVDFDLVPNGVKERIAWTKADSDDALLALDRNGNGLIDDGYELFGDAAPQAPSMHPNGFVALAAYDKPDKGGNDDGRIDEQDAIFASLRLWIDANHNGISEPSELHPLLELGVAGISLAYQETDRQDEYGNQYLYRAKVYGTPHSSVGRWAYDVYLVAY
ncbi:MAG TPA: hypothetical protein VKA60_19090 [Blastocatellia bacterium]|nr:hypothetical protein [Blastocatellia bacterium]